MIRLWVLALALSGLPAFAQLQLSIVNNGQETPVTGTLNLGQASAGDTLDTHVRLRNTGTITVTMTSLHTSGSGFAAVNTPSLPYLMTAGTNIDFTIRFAPSAAGPYSASLVVNTTSLPVIATATDVARLIQVDTGQDLTAGSTIDFGQITTASITKSFLLRNAGATTETVGSVSVTGGGFRLAQPLSLPLTLTSQRTAPLDVVWEPPTAGVLKGTLTIDNRTFVLTGFYRPALPQAIPELRSTAPGSAQQIQIGVRFAMAALRSGSGQMTLTFTPLITGTPDDAAVQFLSGGKRTVSFTVNAGDTQATFGSQQTTTVQTGTTAGTLKMSVSLENDLEELSIPITAAQPVIDQASATRDTTGVTVQISGYDNTHQVSKMEFTFYDKSGVALGSGPISVDVTDRFQQFFSSSNAGGLFSVKAVFPVSGNASQLGAVDVKLTGSAGTATTQRLAF